jgi:2-C-methyl-D-erythritol 4-phosphate cytidylyltransferase/2-C-methyl-D-erythritol 2,4-cyclodiphosphate synthase
LGLHGIAALMALRTGPNPAVSPRVGVVLLAAGRGARCGTDRPKQFLMLGGRPVFSYSLRLFDGFPGVTQLVLVLPGDGLPAEQEPFLQDVRRPLVRVAGGERRQDSVAAGLAALSAPCDVALVHDVARPFPPIDAVERLVRRTLESGGGLLAARCADTVKRAAGDGTVAETIDRERIWLAQTPQAIRADLLPRAIEDLRRPDLDVTDEAALLELWGVSVALVESPATNFKITTAEDLPRAEAWLRGGAVAPGT